MRTDLGAVLLALVLTSAVLVTGCEQSGAELPLGAVDVAAAADVTEAEEVSVPVSSADVIQPVDTMGSTPDLPPEDSCPPGSGCFGEPCSENSDCFSALCVPHLGDMVCSKPCDESCPAGWLCQGVTSADADLTFVCVSQHERLCLPCSENSDCGQDVGSTSLCIDGGAEGSFCGSGCEGETLCPDGYLCEVKEHTGGGASAQCVPESGVCGCSDQAMNLGLSTSCSISNEFGSCEGVRTCAVEGLTACDAMTPLEEVCDGVDNDCDGDVDEVACDDGNPCTEDLCTGSDGCLFEPLTGGECLDGDPCTSADHCADGVCVGAPVLCDDDNPCTDDACDDLGGCAFEPNLGPCDDGKECSVADMCNELGECLGVDLGCDCVTDEECGEYDDGDMCNGQLYCDTSSLPFRCETDPATVVACEAPSEGADAPCQQAVCDPSTGACSIAPDHEGFACEDGETCSVGDVCAQGACASGPTQNCSDGQVCTTDSCEPGVGCVNASNALTCEDGDPCTVGDVCAQGVCTSGAGTFDCDDKNPCTQDSCDASGGCLHAPVGGPCDDGNACTVGEACAAGSCQWLNVLVCNDGNSCTDDSCHPGTGCVFSPTNAACDDLDPCTLGDVCQEGACTPGLGGLPCADDNPCTDDLCEAGAGCSYTANSAPCDDGDACTQADACGNTECLPGAPVECQAGGPCVSATCDSEQGCLQENNAAPCDDSNACTVNDTCQGGGCQGAPVACDDGVACTLDSCDPTAGCVNQPTDGLCDTDLPCSESICEQGAGCVEQVVNDCCGNQIVEAGELCDDGNLIDDDGCSSTCSSELCYDDWQVGAPCNNVDYGNGCSPELTGYHYRGSFDGWQCWWHTRNQAWNTSAETNHYNLAVTFGLEPSQGWCTWCHDWADTPSGMSEGGCGYTDHGNAGAWGWCAESNYWQGGWICFPTQGLGACAGASDWP